MMMAYINIFKHPVKKIEVSDFLPALKENLWGDFSPFDVVTHPTNKRYASHIKRIHDADLSYPIFITSDNVIIDGAHRLSKAALTHKKTIKAYVFDKALMKKFIIHEGFTKDDKIDEAGAEKVKLNEVIMSFYKHFCK
jgi:hypothetical protein